MNHCKLIRIIVIAFIVTFAGSACLLFGERYIDRDLSEQVTLNQEWMEFEPTEGLKAQRDTQELILYPEPTYKYGTSDKRNIAVIDAELIDSKGMTHKASSSGGLGTAMTGNLEITSLSLEFEDLPKDVTFNKVRIRSSISYPVKTIRWRCYNWREVRK